MSERLNELLDEIKALRNGVEELVIILDHIDRNRDEFVDLLVTKRESAEIPETIACAMCDIDSPESLADALQAGWTRLQRDDGSGWNYLGVCPSCQELERAEEHAAFQKQVPEAERPAFVQEFKEKSDCATEGKQTELF